MEGGPLDHEALTDPPLIAGALMAARVRGEVLARLGYTCSAGVAGGFRGWGLGGRNPSVEGLGGCWLGWGFTGCVRRLMAS